jgi:membrane protease YdiL (CAAX protease family)
MANADNSRQSTTTALLALLLLAPVPSIGVVSAMVAAPGTIGHTVFTVSKIWILLFPAAWYLLVERGRPSWSPVRQGGFGIGAVSGAVIGAAILLVYWVLVIDRIDPELVRDAARSMKLLSPPRYLMAAAGWTLVNSLMEEYVYRWFVFRQIRMLGGETLGILGSALVFTAHHVIAVSQYLGPLMTILASSGVFVGGLLWSWLYVRYRSIWPAWISHVLADAAIFIVGWFLLFQ